MRKRKLAEKVSVSAAPWQAALGAYDKFAQPFALHIS